VPRARLASAVRSSWIFRGHDLPFRTMRQFKTTIDIAARPEVVWRLMIDVDRWHEWTQSVTSVKRLNGAPFAVGTRVLIRQPKFPPAIWKVMSIEPHRSFSWVSVAPGLRVTGYHRIDPTSAGSRATLSLDFQGLFGGIWGAMTKGITERYIDFEARGMKVRSEAFAANVGSML